MNYATAYALLCLPEIKLVQVLIGFGFAYSAHTLSNHRRTGIPA